VTETYIIQSDPAIIWESQLPAGTRITVKLILEKLATGESIAKIYQLILVWRKEGNLASLAFAAQASKADVVYPWNQ